MATGDDAWAYYAAQITRPPPDISSARVVPYTCSADLRSSDLTYAQVCPDPWIEVAAQPTPDTAQLVFGKAYFDWAQDYVRNAVLYKPSSTASAKAKILWLLDVQAVMMLGFVALNIPLNSRTPFWSAWNNLRTEFNGNLELMRSNMLSRFSAYPTQQRGVQNAAIAPAPFMVFPLEWAKGYVRNDRGPDLVYRRIYNALTLQGGWSQFENFLPKFPTDAASASAQGDLPLLRGVQQWGLQCVRDGVQTDATYTALISAYNLTPWNNAPSLTWYINTVSSYESQLPELVRKEGAAGHGQDILYPNFATTFDFYQRMTGPFLALRFDKVVQAAFTQWFRSSVPQTDASNRPLLDERGYPLQSPVTFTDAASLFKQDQAALVAAYKRGLQNPSSEFCQQMGNWSGSDIAVPQVPNQAVYVADVAGQPNALSLAQSLPTSVHVPSCSEVAQLSVDQYRQALGPLAGAMDWVGSKLLSVFGAAMGAGWQLPIIAQPFVRTFSVPGFRTVPDGSTVDVLPRVLNAVMAVSALLGVNLCAECPQLGSAVTTQQAIAEAARQRLIAQGSTPQFQAQLQQAVAEAERKRLVEQSATPQFQALLKARMEERTRSVNASLAQHRLLQSFVHSSDPVSPTPRFFGRFLRSLTRAGNPSRS